MCALVCVCVRARKFMYMKAVLLKVLVEMVCRVPAACFP